MPRNDRPTDRTNDAKTRAGALLTFDGRFSRLFARQDLPTAGNWPRAKREPRFSANGGTTRNWYWWRNPEQTAGETTARWKVCAHSGRGKFTFQSTGKICFDFCHLSLALRLRRKLKRWIKGSPFVLWIVQRANPPKAPSFSCKNERLQADSKKKGWKTRNTSSSLFYTCRAGGRSLPRGWRFTAVL